MRFPRLAIAAALTLAVACWMPSPAAAALSESGGTGVFEVPTAESKRPYRLEVGLFGSYGDLGVGGLSDAHVNALRGGVHLGFGLPAGFEVSSTLPILGYYGSTGSGESPFGEDVTARLGDLSARLRWTGPLPISGLRWGWEGAATFATGDDETIDVPGRGPVRPFTFGQNLYAARLMTTWDGLRAGAGVPLRLHAAGGYTFVGDNDRFLLPRAPLPLDLPAPSRDRDNDFLTLGAAVEVDLPRVTLFTEVVTDQFTYARGEMRGSENRLSLLPGLKFWLPGGVSVAGAYSIPLSDDHRSTAFDPDRAYADPEWRVAVSLGTLYRGGQDRSDAPAAMTAPPTPAPVMATAPPAAEPAPAAPARVEPDAAPATAVEQAPAPAPASAEIEAGPAPRAETERRILERRDVQEDPPAAARRSGATTTEPGLAATEAAPPAATRPARARVADTDRDGIPDDRDQCVLVAEDWDGFMDFDGCPDLDNDQDGVLDSRDPCPNEAETFNGYYDQDGCPDQAPVRVESGAETQATPSPAERSAPADAASAERAPARDAMKAEAAAPRISATEPKPARAAVTETPRERVAAAPPGDRMLPPPQAERVVAAPKPERAPAEAEARRFAASPAAGASRDSVARAAVTDLRLGTARTTDSLALSLASQERRVRELNERFARLEAERRAVPAPATLDQAARLAALEGEVRHLREDLAARETSRKDAPPRALSGTAAGPAAPPAVPGRSTPPAWTARGVTDSLAARAGAERREIVRRLDDLESEVTAYHAAAAASPPGGDEPGAAPSASARQALDALLPLGEARVDAELRFDPGSGLPSSPASSTLEAIAAALGGWPEGRITVVGHTDGTGSATANRRLSRERARAVAEMLVDLGASRDQIAVVGRGEQEPVAPNATEEGRSLNRRIEIVRNR